MITVRFFADKDGPADSCRREWRGQIDGPYQTYDPVQAVKRDCAFPTPQRASRALEVAEDGTSLIELMPTTRAQRSCADVHV